MGPWMQVDVKALLRFFDEKPEWSRKRATGVVGIAGEDLNASCFIHYLESEGASADVLKSPDSRPLPVTTGKPKGPRLDRWIEAGWPDGYKTVFQTEIKNWSAHAKDGKCLSISATPEDVTKYKQARWERHWDTQRHTLRDRSTAKVLDRMSPPPNVDCKDVRPLLIFWEAVGPRDQAGKHLFTVGTGSHEFPELCVFSVSSYLRSIPDDNVRLSMPEASERLRILRCLFPADAG